MLDPVAIPTYVDLLLPNLRALDRLGGSGTKNELNDMTISIAGITDEQLGVEFPPDAQQTGSKIVHRLAFARSYLKAIGAVNNSVRGVWTLEPEAKTYLSMTDEDAAKALRSADASARRERRLAKVAAGVTVTDEDETVPGDADEDLQSEITDGVGDWTERLLHQLLALSPDAFERLTQRLLREAGFKNVEVTGKSGDGGLDGVGVYRPSLISFPIFFQCKRYKDSVGPGAVRDFRGAMAGRGEKGLLITTGTFTAEAKKESTRDGAPPVELIDGQDLYGLLKEFAVGVHTKLVESVEIDNEFFAGL